MELTPDQLLSLRRFKGEMNITITDLANEIGISRFPLSRALKGQSITSNNAKKIDDWLIKQYLTKEANQDASSKNAITG
ncbi:hypothetical protein [Ligilactobacillus saerimneri]|uniref:hypothetical protein n=1 Tax=Ligilactobacillus saerimneri TaxID=228229 RepID=UPI0029428C84|nr:hypothetical protein [Ligilactobacillus saerimneri]